MIKIILHGCGGKMCRTVDTIVKTRDDCCIVAGIDKNPLSMPYPTFIDINDCNIDADVIIDFSTATAVPSLLMFSSAKKIPVVLCTTGMDENLLKEVNHASKSIALFRSANMSLGINLLISLVNQAAKVLYDSGFDIEIVEKHHNQKIDAPSGTALALADSVNEALNGKLKYIYDRSQTREKRDLNELGIHAVRGGSIVGEHDVIFAGQDEVVEISHSATSKEIFAVGALKAAIFLSDKKTGLYNMQDIF